MHSTTDDIAIGEAYLNFLKGSDDWEVDFWQYLFDNYGLSKDDLAAMKGITGPARYLPWLSSSVEKLMKVIRRVHGGMILFFLVVMCLMCVSTTISSSCALC